jgi:hypothetical protein
MQTDILKAYLEGGREREGRSYKKRVRNEGKRIRKSKMERRKRGRKKGEREGGKDRN